jgi:hypothetical protein
VVGDELRRQGEQDGGEQAVGFGDDKIVVDVGPKRRVLGRQRDGPPTAGTDLVDVIIMLSSPGAVMNRSPV